MAHPIALTSLTPREAITDALYRAVIGLDANDLALFESAWVQGKDACFDLNGTIFDGMEAICDNVFTLIGPLDTTHTISNVRVDVKEGADAAFMTAYALAQHYRVGEGNDPASKRLLSGSIYFIDLTKDSSDGLWKVKKWTMKIIWVEGDMSIVTK